MKGPAHRDMVRHRAKSPASEKARGRSGAGPTWLRSQRVRITTYDRNAVNCASEFRCCVLRADRCLPTAAPRKRLFEFGKKIERLLGERRLISCRCARGARAEHNRPRSAAYASSKGDRLSNRGIDIARPVRITAGSRISTRTSISGQGCGNGQSRGRSESQQRLPHGDTSHACACLERLRFAPDITDALVCHRGVNTRFLRRSVNSSASLSYFRNASAAAVTACAPDFEIAGRINYQTATRSLALFRAQCRFPRDSDFDGPRFFDFLDEPSLGCRRHRSLSSRFSAEQSGQCKRNRTCDAGRQMAIRCPMPMGVGCNEGLE
jgi:hypothetical protein